MISIVGNEVSCELEFTADDNDGSGGDDREGVRHKLAK